MDQEQVIEVDTREARLSRMRRNVLTSARLLSTELAERKGSFRVRWAFLTLTYRPDAEWSKAHVTGLLKAIRQWLSRRGHALRYVWVLELTKAGKPHYHLAIALPKGMTLPKPDKRGWWSHGLTRIEWARNVIGYLAKYCSKGSAENLYPKGARISGAGGLSQCARSVRRWWFLPSYVRERVSVAHDVRRVPGGGFRSKTTGEGLPSVFGLVAVGKRSVRLLRLEDRWRALQALRLSGLTERPEVLELLGSVE